MDFFMIDLLLHRTGYFSACYFPEGATPPGRTVQNAVNGVVKEQKQPVAQG
jgi:hypothetical protein